MPFALGQRAHDEVVRAISNLRRFEHGGISGAPGPARYGLKALPRQYAVGLDDAQYVVYCYDTPIAWVVMADDATEEGRVNYMPDWQYSATTTYHQGLVWEAWGDRIADPNEAYSRSENRGTARGRTSDARYGRPEVGRVPSGTVVRPGETVPVSLRAAFNDTRSTVSFQDQDELMDEVRGYVHPAHP